MPDNFIWFYSSVYVDRKKMQKRAGRALFLLVIFRKIPKAISL